ncbi:MAG: hypothetical protein PHY59_06755, partial [Methanobacterium sp.]|nr:hypothetical protein [Methanobacterium sp.]
MRDKFWIVFIIFLVLSITPISASELVDLSKEMNDDDVLLDQTNKGMLKHVDNVKSYALGVIRCVVNIFNCVCFIVANIWNWWNWGDVWNNICKVAKNVYKINNYIDSTSNEASGTLMSLVNSVIAAVISGFTLIEYTDKLPEADEPKVSSQINIINNLTLNNDTNTTINETSQNLNETNPITNITPQNNFKGGHVSNSNVQNISFYKLQTGDVVIYKSKDLYYRYLQFVSIKNSSFVMSNQTVNIQTVVLNGPYNKIKEISYEDFIKGYTGQAIPGDINNLRASSKIVNHQYQLQLKEINNAQKVNNKTRDSTILKRFFYMLGTAVFVAGTILFLGCAYITWRQRSASAARNPDQMNLRSNTRSHTVNSYGGPGEPVTSTQISPISYAQEAAVAAEESGWTCVYFILSAALCITGIVLFALFWDDCNSLLGKLDGSDGSLDKNKVDLNSWAVTGNWTAPVAGCL